MQTRIFIVLLAFTIPKFVSAQKYKGDSWANVKSAGSGTLTVVYYEQPGLIYLEGGKVKGACVDLVNEFVNYVQTKHGKKITVKYAGKEPEFSEFLSVIQSSNDVLGVANVIVTEERKKILKFAPPFLSNPVVMISHKDAPLLASLDEISTKFNGYSAEVIKGSIHTKHIEKIKKDYMPALPIAYGSNGSDILKRISTNPKLFTILEFVEFVDAQRKNLPVKSQKINFGEAEQLAFVMSKQSDWDEPWNEFLTPDYRKSVKYRKIIADNLGATFLSIVK
jgi:ABC-type amino acid transport substrate-binding protein